MHIASGLFFIHKWYYVINLDIAQPSQSPSSGVPDFQTDNPTTTHNQPVPAKP